MRPESTRKCVRIVAAIAAATLASIGMAWAASEIVTGSASGLPIPRFVSLKSDRVNVRAGPTKDHDVTWVYTRPGLPVEVTAEFENWRKIRDWEGAEGWVYHSLLSGRRTGLVTAKSKEDLISLHEKADGGTNLVARLQAGVLGSVKRCTGLWCRVIGENFDGWIQQERLWGVYPNEKVE
jgi:SH3-like domain-containing protein